MIGGASEAAIATGGSAAAAAAAADVGELGASEPWGLVLGEVEGTREPHSLWEMEGQGEEEGQGEVVGPPGP